MEGSVEADLPTILKKKDAFHQEKDEILRAGLQVSVYVGVDDTGARHRGQALTRTQIVEAVWGFAPDLESEKTIKVHIRHLREKIENDPSHPKLLLTVPGIGYRLASEVMKP